MDRQLEIQELNVFSVKRTDTRLIAFLKEEALNAVIDCSSKDKHRIYEFWKATVEYYKALNKCNDDLHASEPIVYLKKLIDFIPYLECEIPITKININEQNFIGGSQTVIKQHKRCPYLFWNSSFLTTTQNSLYYSQAYHLHVKKIFDFENHTTDEACENLWQQPIYISKGGVLTGEVIQIAHIKVSDIIENKLQLRLPIIIPCAKIYYKDKYDRSNLIFVVDHREPTLKLLQSVYNASTIIDETIKNQKLNLRNIYKDSEENPLSKIKFNEPIGEIKGDYHCVMLKNGLWQLNCKVGTIATYKNGNVTIFYSRAKYKHVPPYYWEKFTGYNLRRLKDIYKSGNINITFS